MAIRYPIHSGIEAHQQATGHDRAFEGEEDKGEAGKNNAGDHRAEIAEAGAAGDQVKVNVVARGGDRQRNAGEEDHQRRHQDRIDGVAGAPAIPMLAPMEKSAR